MTKQDLLDHQKALEEKFGANAPIAYANVTQTQLSIARHYGGCQVNKAHYTYFPNDDLLVRDDVVKLVCKLKKGQTT